MRQSRTLSIALVVGLILITVACSSAKPKAAAPTTTTTPPDQATTTTTPDAASIVFTSTDGNIDAYLSEKPYTRQRVVAAGTGPDGTVPHGQVCFVPDGSRRFVIAETRTPAGVAPTAGWGLYQLTGDEIGNFRVRRTGGWDSPGSPSADAPTTYGCAFLPDGRLFTTDVGNQRDGAPTGRLVEWFAPFDAPTVASCAVATDLASPLGLTVDDDGAIYLASSRAPTAGVWRYRGTFPGDASSCVTATPEPPDQTTTTTAAPDPSVPSTTIPPGPPSVTAKLLIPGGTVGLAAPTAVAFDGAHGALFVTAASDSLLVPFDLTNPDVPALAEPKPSPPASPFGVVVAPSGLVIWVDLGLTTDAKGVSTPADRAGSLVVADPSKPSASGAVVMDDGIDAPDGLGLYNPGAGGGGSASRV